MNLIIAASYHYNPRALHYLHFFLTIHGRSTKNDYLAGAPLREQALERFDISLIEVSHYSPYFLPPQS